MNERGRRRKEVNHDIGGKSTGKQIVDRKSARIKAVDLAIPIVAMVNADEVFLSVGDKSKRLNFEQRLQLVYAKGVKYFEDQPIANRLVK